MSKIEEGLRRFSPRATENTQGHEHSLQFLLKKLKTEFTQINSVFFSVPTNRSM